jgi:quinol-cytochrome oxidoreductase complex cytochrome b subunit
MVKNLYYTHLRTSESGSVNQQRASVKTFWGILLLFLTPVFLFVRPVTKAAVVRDLLLVIWWAFILWLLITGKKESKPTDSK